LNQQGLAARSGLTQAQISYLETSRRRPTLSQLTALGQALEVSLDQLLRTGPGGGLADLTFELRNLGVVDFKATGAKPPTALRPIEQTLALALAGDEPETRIIEAIPSVLAWNVFDPELLKAYGGRAEQRVLHRAAWLADAALAIDKAQGFPGGIWQPRNLAGLVRIAKRPDQADSLGRPATTKGLAPLWKKWNVTYAADLSTFRTRAEGLHRMIQADSFWRSFFERRRGFGAGRRESDLIV
jgi:transcriptional regulator with XRE-family HTH domain